MSRPISAFFLVLVLLTTACSSISNTGGSNSPEFSPSPYGYDEEMSVSSFAVSTDKMAYDEGTLSQDLVSVVDRQIIKTGDLSLHVTDVRSSVTEMTDLVEAAGGNVSDTNITRGNRSYSAYLTLRIPSEKFDEVRTALKALAVYVDSEYTNANDVTEYYTDLQTRLTNKQAEEQQYLDVLKQANTVDEILAVTQYLSSVRYEIESLQGQIKSYDDQISLSTLTLYLGEDESVQAASETWKPRSTFSEALSNWVVFLQRALDAGIYLVIFGWPVLLIAAGVFVWKRRRVSSGKTKR